MKIRSVGAELFHADGRRDKHNEDNGRLLRFCETLLKTLALSTGHVDVFR